MLDLIFAREGAEPCKVFRGEGSCHILCLSLGSGNGYFAAAFEVDVTVASKAATEAFERLKVMEGWVRHVGGERACVYLL